MGGNEKAPQRGNAAGAIEKTIQSNCTLTLKHFQRLYRQLRADTMYRIGYDTTREIIDESKGMPTHADGVLLYMVRLQASSGTPFALGVACALRELLLERRANVSATCH